MPSREVKQSMQRSPSPPSGRSPRQILDSIAKATDARPTEPGDLPDDGLSGRVVVQEFRPLVRSLEWILSAAYWRRDGLLPFVRSEVPFVVNNTPWNAENAAELLFDSLSRLDPLPARIQVLELGAGIGLFARQLLVRFEELSREANLNLHERLRYVVTDGSPSTVSEWVARGLFERFGEQVVPAVSDASDPGSLRAPDGTALPLLRPNSVHAVFANYLLDSMPLTILRPGPSPSECLEFQVRTRIDRRHEEAVRAETGLGLDDVVQLVRELELGSDPEPAERLLPLLSYFEFEIAYLPFESEPPYLDLATRLQRGARRLALNYGAIGCVDRCVRLLSSGGFALISDLGPTRPERIADLSYAARFGSSVAACVNFPLLEHHLRSLGCEVLEPDGDPDRALHTRLVLPPRSDTDGVSSAESLAAVFARTFGRDGFGDTERRLADATSHINAGRYDAALDAFRDALDRYPRDWNVLGQTAQFLTQQLLRPAEAEELARRALDVHPAHSTFLWNTWGNALFCLGRTAEAHTAYLRANELDPRDAQTQLNLAYTHAQFGRSGDALLAVARGLEADHDGRFEASLLAKQKEIVATLTRQRVEQRERETRRHQAFTALD